MRRRYRNAAEEAFRSAAEEAGVEVTKRGWPDFFCRDAHGKMFCVEVKPYAGMRPKDSQREILEFLAAHGIRCYVWTPQEGFRPFP